MKLLICLLIEIKKQYEIFIYLFIIIRSTLLLARFELYQLTTNHIRVLSGSNYVAHTVKEKRSGQNKR